MAFYLCTVYNVLCRPWAKGLRPHLQQPTLPWQKHLRTGLKALPDLVQIGQLIVDELRTRGRQGSRNQSTAAHR